jgi:hypothetical protein
MSTSKRPKLEIWYALAAIGLIGGLALRLSVAMVAKTPGQGDSAFYYTVAKNIVDGRGLVVDYVVYFFLGLVPITHYAGDFWNPLAEILLSFPMMLFGKSVFNALLASIAAGVIPAAVGYFAGLRFSRSVAVAVLVAILTFFSPFQVAESVRTEAIIFAGAFGSLALLLDTKGRQQPRYFFLGAICTGLAHFVRQDGVLLLATLLLCIAITPLRWPKRLWVAGAAFAIHLIVISPMLVKNLVTYNSPLPPGPTSTAFMTSYEDFHSYGKDLTWQNLRATWGIRGLIRRRLHTAGENLAQIKYFADPVLVYFASLGLVNMVLLRRRAVDMRILQPPLIYSGLVFAFYTLLASFSGPGSLPKSLAVLMPFICIPIVDLLESRLPSKRLAVLVVLLLAGYSGYRGYQRSHWSATYYNGLYEKYATVQAIVLEDARQRGAAPEDVVLMAREVWEVYEATGIKCVMIPNNDLETIVAVARHYGVAYMLLPAPRRALEDIYHGTTPDSRFNYIGAVSGTDWRVYWLDLDAP